MPVRPGDGGDDGGAGELGELGSGRARSNLMLGMTEVRWRPNSRPKRWASSGEMAAMRAGASPRQKSGVSRYPARVRGVMRPLTTATGMDRAVHAESRPGHSSVSSKATAQGRAWSSARRIRPGSSKGK